MNRFEEHMDAREQKIMNLEQANKNPNETPSKLPLQTPLDDTDLDKTSMPLKKPSTTPTDGRLLP